MLVGIAVFAILATGILSTLSLAQTALAEGSGGGKGKGRRSDGIGTGQKGGGGYVGGIG